ncbi:hypothetical protein HNP98_000310 [Hymenobacter sp. 9A]|uniref:Uncharacterized protein n=1 Tax=Hymenobacter caeli TaxID=2735894 RepID=A0ABX2FM08_9BACT|nr:hypothetical protein [Hymenobacter caeli]
MKPTAQPAPRARPAGRALGAGFVNGPRADGVAATARHG